jgi:ABC-type transport system substrate-binding protein
VVLERSPIRQLPKDRLAIIPEASTRSAELIAGNVDIITNVAPDQVDAINGSGTAEVQAVQGTRRMYVGFNLSEPFAAMPGGDAIQDPAVRRALQYAIDVPTICEQLLNFPCERATGLVNPPNDHPELEPYPYDPAMAEQLLDEAGWPRLEDGNRFTIRFQAGRGRYLNDENVVLAIAQYLTDVGINVELDIMEWGSVYVPSDPRAQRRAPVLPGLRRGQVVPALRHDRPRQGGQRDQLHPLGRPPLVRPLGGHRRRRDARGAACHHR